MKLYPLLLASLLLVTLLIPALLAEPRAAAFVPCNNITLERNGMTWDYDEKTTDDEAVLFRSVIDGESGNKDGFVNAWEILKMEVLLSDKMKKAIEEEPDVKLNSTSDTVELKEVDFRIPEGALGRTNKSSLIINRASITYSFKEEVSPGTDIWLMGTPNSSVVIALPPGLNAGVIKGLNNKSLEFENNRTVLRGNFSSKENITLRFSENKSFKAELQKAEFQDMKTNRNKSAENETGKKENSTMNTGVNGGTGNVTGILNNILKGVNRSIT